MGDCGRVDSEYRDGRSPPHSRGEAVGPHELDAFHDADLAAELLFGEAEVIGVFAYQAGDGDAATSDGIFVDALDSVAVGDRTEVRGTVDEFFGETRIGDVRLIEVEASGGAVAATAVDLPVAEGASLEPYEGMLITFPEYLYASATFNTHRFG